MSDLTPRLSLPLVGDHSQKRLVMNEGLMRLESLVQAQVYSRTTAAEPATPSDGDSYILPAGRAGANWDLIAAGSFVRSESGTWETVAFPDGAIVHIADENRFVLRSGGAWAAFETVIGALDNLTWLGIGTAADAYNVLALKGAAALLSAQYAGAGGSGDISLTLNKETDADTAQVLFQKDYSSRAILGLLGDNNLSLKVSPDGATFITALCIDRTTGDTSNLNALDASFRLRNGADRTKAAAFSLAGLSAGATRIFGLPDLSATLAHTGTAEQTFGAAITVPAGSSATTGLRFSGQAANTGLYASGNRLIYTITGTDIVSVNSTAMWMGLLGSGGTSYNFGGSINGTVQDVRTGQVGFGFLRATTTAAAAPRSIMARTRGATTTDMAAVQSGDMLGEYAFSGSDGVSSAPIIAASLRAEVSGTVTSGSVPADLTLRFGSAFTERFRFTASGELQMGGSNVVIDANRNVRARVYTVATLPAASTAAGQRAQVSDAASPAFAAAVSGGGSTHTPVYSNGTAWLCG